MAAEPPKQPQSLGAQLAIQYGYAACKSDRYRARHRRRMIRRCMFLWIFLSAAVILVNKYVLSVSGFPYPIALTCTHMAFCSILAFLVVKLGFAEATPISADTYLRWDLLFG